MGKGATTPELPSRDKGRAVLLLFFLLLLYVVLPRLHNFSSSFDSLRRVDWTDAALVALLVVATYFLAAGTYVLLALRRVQFWRTLSIQGASAFANRLLPAGLGGLTLNVRFLQKSGHSLPQALAVAGTNNTLGIVGHCLLLAVVAIAGHSEVFEKFHTTRWANVEVAIIVVGVAVAVGVAAFGRLRHYLLRLTGQVFGQVARYRNHPLRLLGALACSLALTSCYVAMLYVSTLAVGAHISTWNVFIAFTAGMALGTLTPTPGGLGGAEAGWVAGLMAYGLAAPTALAAVLFYRLLSYWLPLVPGFVLFVASRKWYMAA